VAGASIQSRPSNAWIRNIRSNASAVIAFLRGVVLEDKDNFIMIFSITGAKIQ
jgi:hypothetical protein